MIDALSNYAIAIACNAFILNLIQMILPSGKCKKYILFVCTMIMTLIIVEPIINLLNDDFDILNVLKQNQNEYGEFVEAEFNVTSEEKIISKYKENIENGIVSRLEAVGYEVIDMKCEYDEKTLEPQFLRLRIVSKNGEVLPVKIEVSNEKINETNEITFSEELEIRQILKSEYGISEVEIVKWKIF